MPDPADEAARHAHWMEEAVALARAGMRIHGGGPFGAVVVADGKLVGRGYNQVTPLLDPTAHAEVTAIRDACQALQRFDLRGCVLYTSCEPCPMCFPRSTGPGSTAFISLRPAKTRPDSDSTTILFTNKSRSS